MATLTLNLVALEQLQKQKGWSDTELAAALGVSVTQVWRVKNGGQPGNRFIAGLIKLSGKQMPFCDLVI